MSGSDNKKNEGNSKPAKGKDSLAPKKDAPVKEKATKQEDSSKKALPDEKTRSYREPETLVDEFFLEERNIELEKIAIRKSLGMSYTEKSSAKKKKEAYKNLKLKLYKAGLEVEPAAYIKVVFFLTLALLAPGLLIIGAFMLSLGYNFFEIFIFAVLWWVLGFLFFYTVINLLSTIFLGYRAFRRRLEVERVLPEFLRLVATNYRSGLPLHKALTASNRPRFGIFSREIELIAKSTRVKGDLSKSLEIFGKKFDSKVLERAMNSISMSVRSGSNISELLEDIADNITKMRNMRLRLAANVKNYVIFIVVAGLIVAPLMFAMSYQMNLTIGDVKDRIDTQRQDAAGQQSFFAGLSGKGGVEPGDFDWFAVFMILTNSVVSALVISMINYGNFQQGIPSIPFFIGLSVTIYFLGKIALSGLFGIV